MAVQITGSQIQNNTVTAGKIDLTGTFNFASGTLRAAAPSVDTDVATKAYVDSVASGLAWKSPVKAATTGNITLSGTQTVDGVSLLAGDRVLVKDQTDGKENGVYVVASGSWTRATDMDAGSEFPSSAVFVQQGSTQGDFGYVCTNDAVTVGSTAITFAQFTGAANIVAGDGLSKTGNELAVNVDNSTLEISADALKIKDSGVTATQIASAAVSTAKIQDAAVTNAKLANSTISGKSLGANLDSLSAAAAGAISMTSYNGSAAVSDLAVNVDDASIEIATNALQLKDSGVSTAKIANAAVTGLKIEDGAVSNTKISDGAITGAKVQDGTLANAKLANSTISGKSLGANLDSLSAAAAGALTMTAYNGSAAVSNLAVNVDGVTVEIATNALQVKNAAITSAKLADGSVSNTKISDGAITGAKVQDGTLANAKLANSTISGKALGTNLDSLSASVSGAITMTAYNGSAAVSNLAVNVDGVTVEIDGSNKVAIKNLGVGTAKLADNAVSTAKIANAAVTTAKLSDGSVSNAKIIDAAVTPAKISVSPVYESATGDGSAVSFDLSGAIASAWLGGVVVYRNGLAIELVASSPSGQDQYTVAATAGAGGVGRVTFGSAPSNGDKISVLYWG